MSRVPNIPRAKFQLVGVSCLKLADSFNERSQEFYLRKNSKYYASITDFTFSREDVVAMEREVAKAIDY